MVLVEGGSGERTRDNRVGARVLGRYSEHRGPRLRIEQMQVAGSRAERYAKLGAAVEYRDEEPGRGLRLLWH